MATINDIRALGITVEAANPTPGGGEPADGLYRCYWPAQSPTWETIVHVNDAQAIGWAADPAAHAERVWRRDNPTKVAAAVSLRGKGYDVARPIPGDPLFRVDGEDVTDIVTASTTRPRKRTPVQDLAASINGALTALGRDAALAAWAARNAPGF